ncbi:Type VI secretion-like protein VasL [Vibrio cholerae]|nr:Type VI secretion-like protein VasL [Vibrio cholerae]
MANISLLAKRGKWAELEKQTKSLEIAELEQRIGDAALLQ